MLIRISWFMSCPGLVRVAGNFLGAIDGLEGNEELFSRVRLEGPKMMGIGKPVDSGLKYGHCWYVRFLGCRRLVKRKYG